jgi:hypothetical protein
VAMLTTTSFESLARMQMRALGAEVPLVVVEHPIGGIGPDAVELRGAAAAEQGATWFEAALKRSNGG